jgi:hypothetical protein
VRAWSDSLAGSGWLAWLTERCDVAPLLLRGRGGAVGRLRFHQSASLLEQEDYIQITVHTSAESVNRAYGTYSLAKLKQGIEKAS